MKYQLRVLFVTGFYMLTCFNSIAQQAACKKPFLFYLFEQVDVQEPEDAAHREKYAKIAVLKNKVQELVLSNPSFVVVPFTNFKELKRFGQGYILVGSVQYDRGGKDYRFYLTLMATCGTPIVDVQAPFQLYGDWEPEGMASAAIKGLFEKVDIHKWELNERASKNVGLGGFYRGGEITLVMDRGLMKGQSTNVLVRVVDCDGQSLPNKKITTTGTTGGTFTPSTFTTNDNGSALVKFTKTGDKMAIAKAQCETNNVSACKDQYTGTALVAGIEGTPVRIDIDYFENTWQSLKRATLPGVKITGGEETESTFMAHFATLYHYPSSKLLREENLLIETSRDAGDRPHTLHAAESGWCNWTKVTEPAFIVAGPANMVQAVEKGEEMKHSGSPDGTTMSEVAFYLGKKGDTLNPPVFMWNVQYETSNEGMAAAGANLVKGDSSVKWKETKITDPKSIYKMKYVIEQEIDVQEELKKGNKAMKDLFGFDLDQLTGIIDPTNPQSGMVGAHGKRMIRVTILSPYVK